MSPELPAFRKPTAGERFFNRAFGLIVGLGLGLPHNYLVEVRGRKSGKIYSTPIDLLDVGGKRFLVAPRGRTQWVRNAEAAGEVTLKKGRTRQRYRIRPFRTPASPNCSRPTLTASGPRCSATFPCPPARRRRPSPRLQTTTPSSS